MLAQCGFSALGPSFFDGAAPANTRAHLSDGKCHRGFAYATCCTPQPLVARQCRGRGFGIESTADVLLTKPSTRTSWASRFYRFCRKIREPTSGLEPLTPAPATSDTSSVAGVCRGLQMRIFRGVSFPCLAACCTVSRSRWCQSGVKIALVAPGEREGAYTARTKAASLNTTPTIMHFRPSLFCSSEE